MTKYFDCWIFFDNGTHARYPLPIVSIEWYRRHGVVVDVVGTCSEKICKFLDGECLE